MTSAPEEATQSTPSSGRNRSVIAIVLGVLAVFIAPVITGAIAIIVGVTAFRRDRTLGRWALAVAIAGTIIGIVLYYGVRGHDFLRIY